MKSWTFLGGLGAIVIFAGVAASCGGSSSSAPTATCIETPPSPPFEEGFPCARQTLIAAATAGLVPEGLIIATKTPDLSAVMSRDETLRALRGAGLGALLDAVERSDPDAVLAQFDWKLSNCGGRGDDGCPAGVAAATMLPKIDTGADTFYVSAETVRPYIARLMAGGPLRLTFVSRSKSQAHQYVVEFDGSARFLGFPPLASDDSEILGLSLNVDGSAPHPVQHLNLSSIPTRVAPGYPTPAACGESRYGQSEQSTDQQILWITPC